jgi:hypothetical protein
MDITSRALIWRITMKNCVFIFFMALFGCTSIPIKEIRQEPPARAAIVTADYADIGGCVAEGMQTGPRGTWMIETGDLTYEVIHRPSERRLAVTGRAGGGHAIPIIDILFLGQPGGRTRIESRWGGMSGIEPHNRTGGQRIDERVWPIVESCVGTPIEVKPPVPR